MTFASKTTTCWVISKQAGLVCHPSIDHADGTLVNALVHHCGADHLCNVQGEDDRPGIVHRLDRDTTGLMLAAKNDATGLALMADIHDRAVDRRYLALVHGVIPHDTGMIDAPIARAVNERTRMAVRECLGARRLNHVRVLERFEHGPRDNGYTLIDCKLFCARTDSHDAHATRHPLVGDPVYNAGGPKDADANFSLDRQFLVSSALHPAHDGPGCSSPTTSPTICKPCSMRWRRAAWVARRRATRWRRFWRKLRIPARRYTVWRMFRHVRLWYRCPARIASLRLQARIRSSKLLARIITMTNMTPPTGVLIANTGSPASPARATYAYLNFLMDPRIRL